MIGRLAIPVGSLVFLGNFDRKVSLASPGFGAGAFANGEYALSGAFWLVTRRTPFCFAGFRCPSPIDIAQMVTSENTLSALRRSCALMEGLVCFFTGGALVNFGNLRKHRG
jgi:hypothetical protein